MSSPPIPSTPGCNEAYEAWWGPRPPQSHNYAASHYNLHLFLTGYSRVRETREGGAGGAELGRVRVTVPKGWKVIFLAKSWIGVPKNRGLDSIPGSHPRACVVLDLIRTNGQQHTHQMYRTLRPDQNLTVLRTLSKVIKRMDTLTFFDTKTEWKERSYGFWNICKSETVAGWVHLLH